MAIIRKFDFGKESAEDRADANRQTASLAGLAIALFLVVVGVCFSCTPRESDPGRLFNVWAAELFGNYHPVR